MARRPGSVRPSLAAAAAAAAAAWLPLAAGLAARLEEASKPLQGSAAATAEREGQLASVGRVNGSWHLCASPVVAAKAGPKSPIPRILHQTYKSKELPGFFVHCRESWLQETPSWKHRIWLDHENRALVKVHYPWFLETYDAYPHTIQRVDAARIFMLHRYGGVYADMDIEALRDPSALFDTGHDLVFFYQVPPKEKGSVIDAVEMDGNRVRLGTISNALMASKPGHPFWLFLAKMMAEGRESGMAEAAKSDIPHMDIYLTTGPSMLSRALGEYQQQNSDVKVAIFSKKYWSPFQWGMKEDPCEVHWECRAQFPEAFVVSHWTRSWIFCQKGSNRHICKPSVSLLEQDTYIDSVSWCP